MPKKCIESECNKFASFNISGEKYGVYCFTHKKDDMVNVNIIRCIHNKQKTRCKECGGSEICEHNRIKSRCKECGGSQICEHNKRKSYCKECRGTDFCEHNKYKLICKECHGSQICEHNRHKIQCKECGGSQICPHNNYKSRCKECGGSQICEHNKRKTRCKECGGCELCKHNRIKSRCKECDGSDLCEHSKQKATCKECGGSQICEHNKRKARCKDCGGADLCKSSWCDTKKNLKYEGYCFNCFLHLFPDRPNTRNYKTKEKAVADYILERFPNFTWTTDKIIKDGCSKKRPDLLLDLGYQIVIIEIDENQHESYNCSCENKRLMLLSQDVGHRPIIFIRFNPDDYMSSNGKITSCWNNNQLGICCIKKTKLKEWNDRLHILNRQIEYWTCPKNKTEKTIEIIQLFYDFDIISAEQVH
jgi:hypothetical protein